MSTWILYHHPLDMLPACLLISVICKLHNLRPRFKIPFYLVPPIHFSFRTHTFKMCTIRSWSDTWFHDNRHMNTSADVSKNLKFTIIIICKCWFLVKSVLGACTVAGTITAHDQSLSNRNCNMFNFAVSALFGDSFFCILITEGDNILSYFLYLLSHTR